MVNQQGPGHTVILTKLPVTRCTDLLPGLEVGLPVLELLGVALVKLLQLGSLVLHKHLALLVLELRDVISCGDIFVVMNRMTRCEKKVEAWKLRVKNCLGIQTHF